MSTRGTRTCVAQCTHTLSCTCSYNHTIHDVHDVHDYLSQHVHIGSPLNEGVHCIHLTLDCSPHEGRESITLRTKTADDDSSQTCTNTSSGWGAEHASCGRVPHPPCDMWQHFCHTVPLLPQDCIYMYLLTLVLLTSAPTLSSRSIICRWPHPAASISGVVPPYVWA